MLLMFYSHKNSGKRLNKVIRGHFQYFSKIMAVSFTGEVKPTNFHNKLHHTSLYQVHPSMGGSEVHI